MRRSKNTEKFILTEAEDVKDIKDQNLLDSNGKTSGEEVKDDIEKDTNGEATYSNADANKIASEINKTADDVNAAAAVNTPAVKLDDAPIKTRNRLGALLDWCLYNSYKNRATSQKATSNLLVSGLPGSGKSATIVNWVKARGVHLIDINVKDKGVEDLLYGLPLRDLTATDANQITSAPSKLILEIEKEEYKNKVVIFLDEFNRQTNPKIRASLLTLINEHKVVIGDKTHYLDNILFVICAINPAVKEDLGAAALNGAELSRFVQNVSGYDSDKAETQEYSQKSNRAALNRILQKKGKKLKDDALIDTANIDVSSLKLPPVDFGAKLDELDKMTDEQREAYFEKVGLIDIVRQMLLADYIVNYPGFDFDHAKDLKDLYREGKTIWNKRLFTDIIIASEGQPDLVAYWAENSSNLLQKNVDILVQACSEYKVSAMSDDEILDYLNDIVEGGVNDFFSADVQNGEPIDQESEIEDIIDNLDDIDEKELDEISEDELAEDDDDMFGSGSFGSDDDEDEFEKQASKAIDSISW